MSHRFATLTANVIAFTLILAPYHACRLLWLAGCWTMTTGAPAAMRAFLVALCWSVAASGCLARWLSHECRDTPAACRNLWHWGRSVAVQTTTATVAVATLAVLLGIGVGGLILEL